MTGTGGEGNGGRARSGGVLADRVAAALIHHEPGWRLPRLTALARRYHVSAAEMDAAIGELAARHLLRRLPDGQVYRASPAEYQVSLAGLSGLSAYVDPMGGQLACRSRQVSARRVPEDTGRALGLAPGETVLVIRCQWLVGGEPGAVSATYLPQRLAGLAGPFAGSLLAVPGRDEPEDARESAWQPEPAQAEPGQEPAGTASPGTASPGTASPGTAAGAAPACLPRAVQLELGPPPPSVARSLRLPAGQPVATVTVRFADPAGSTPVALTTAMLRPDLFRIVLQAPGSGGPGGFPSAWTRPGEGWEP